MEKVIETNQEKLEQLKKISKDALNALGKKNFALITHGASFPSQEGLNPGMGSPISEGATLLVDFASGIFNSIQLGPSGKTKAVDSSPYTGTIFSNNPLFIDLKPLVDSKWANILSVETLNDIIENNPNKHQPKVAYGYIFQKQDEALKEAFYNFVKKAKNKESLSPEDKRTVEKIEKNFQKFKKENQGWLEKDSIYEALSSKHGNDYWPLWTDELDKNLYNAKTKEAEEEAMERINSIKEEYADIIEFYSFCQYIISEQKEEMLSYAEEKGIKMIADRQVAFSDRDVWAYQHFFLEGWFLGCPPDYFSEDGQAWGFPIMDPEKTFNEDGSLSEGGKLLKSLYKKMFKENPGGVRIDHLVGLIDPWVYKRGSLPKVEEGAGRLFSSPEHPELSKYAVATIDDLDFELEPDKEYRVKTLTKEQIKKYGMLIEKIVIAAAKEEGLSKNEIICEDLGTVTYPVEQVMKEYELQGMRLTQFVVPEKPEHAYRCKNITENSWAMVGTHDNEPISRWANAMVNTHEAYLHAQNLTEDLLPKEREFQKDEMITRLTQDANYLRKVKLSEIFVSKAENIQIFFTDFFGIDDVYNKPGTSGDQNWSLSLPDNFEDFYFEQLKQDKGINLPEILKMAMESRGKDFILKHKDLITELEILEEKLRN
ncbi:MAG: 4-alpha-glucanotransferase [Candidatus Gastranaerophilales bacterium]|nr:4-alpha-glucanotransferase [Candidatus Gastranaerophilales bacterium]